VKEKEKGVETAGGRKKPETLQGKRREEKARKRKDQPDPVKADPQQWVPVSKKDRQTEKQLPGKGTGAGGKFRLKNEGAKKGGVE